jgi:hypothetical protein
MTYKTADPNNYSSMQQPDVPTKNADDTLLTVQHAQQPAAIRIFGFQNIHKLCP